jgi:hypothetical protein
MSRMFTPAIVALSISAVVLVVAIIVQRTHFSEKHSKSSVDPVLHPPGTNASAAEQKAFSNLIQARAQTASVLVVSKDCKVQPIVMRLTYRKTFTIQNSDEESHTLIFNPKRALREPFWWS